MYVWVDQIPYEIPTYYLWGERLRPGTLGVFGSTPNREGD